MLFISMKTLLIQEHPQHGILKVVPREIASTTSTLYSLILLSASILGRWSGLAYQNIPKKKASHFWNELVEWNGYPVPHFNHLCKNSGWMKYVPLALHRANKTC